MSELEMPIADQVSHVADHDTGAIPFTGYLEPGEAEDSGIEETFTIDATSLLLLLGILTGGVLVWRYQVHIQYERALQRTVAEHTHSLREANRQLEQTATDLRRTQAELVESAHRAGMAEVASDVLHNIGNALTSLQVSASMVESRVNGMRVDFLHNLSNLVLSQKHDLPAFFADRKGQMIPTALGKVAEKMEDCRDDLLNEIKILNEQIFGINEIVISQRDYTFAGNFFENLDVKNLMEDVLRFQEANLEEFHIRVERDYADIPAIRGAKAVLLHIFNHLVKNAVEALSGSNRDNRLLRIHFTVNHRDNVVLGLEDNGIGIDEEHLTAIFSQHWVSKKGNKRSNLHYCANAISGMGGSLTARSGGIGTGAIFELEIPRNPKGRSRNSMDERAGYDQEKREKNPETSRSP